MAEVLLAKHLKKTKVIAETGAGQHGVALATAAAYFGLECEIHMGAVDIDKESPNVSRMRILGATVIPATHGLQTLKEAVDSAFSAYLKDPINSIYCIGSVVGPHPFPFMVREFQSVVGIETQEQFIAAVGEGPQHVVACCGGGSNSIGLFAPFIDDGEVHLHAVEPYGRGTANIGEHAASLEKGTAGTMHGFRSIMLKDSAAGADSETPAAVHSVASGLDYPSIGPEHAYLYSMGRTEKHCGATDDEAIKSFFLLSRLEGIIPALESSHAVAYAIRLAKGLVEKRERGRIVIGVSGRGDKDLDFVLREYSHVMKEMDQDKAAGKTL